MNVGPSGSGVNLASVLDGLGATAVLSDGDGGEVDTVSLRRRATEIADELVGRGVEPRQIVAVRLPNSAELIATLFGVWTAGAVYMPLNPRAADVEVEASLAQARPAALVGERGIVPLDEPRAADAGTALMQFTSGTTGRPKLVPLRHDTVLDMLDRVVASIRAAPRSHAPASSPMPNLVPVSLSLWAGIYQVLFAFRVGAPVVLMERFETLEFARLVARHQIRSTVLPPAALAMLANDERVVDLAPLRIVRSITAPLSPTQAEQFHERFGVIVLNSYGQTELGGEVVGWTTADVREFGAAKLGSVGRAHRGIGVRTDSESGELLIRTPNTVADRIPAELRERLLADGWFRTGDLGRVDDEGFVWLDGRVSDMINRGGNKVFPAHVEEVIRRHDSVADVVVAGEPDDRLGEVPVAYVVTAAGAVFDSAELEDWCRLHLTPYRVPARFVAIDELPRNEIGKVVKSALPRAESARSPHEPS